MFRIGKKLGENEIYGMAFSLPFFIVFVAFVIFPILIEFYLSWVYEPMVGAPRISHENFDFVLSDPTYRGSLINTLLYVGIGVNAKMIFSFLLSGFLTLKHRIVKAFNAVYLLPWAIPLVAGASCFRWMLAADWGIINTILVFFGFPRVNWLGQWSTAMFSVILFHVWKFTPFWTLVFFAGRQSIPTELYEAARVDGAGTKETFRHITLPLLKNLYIMNTLISTIWTLGDFVVVWLVTRGGPADLTHVISTLAYRYGFWMGYINVGAAAIITLLPVTLLLSLVVMKWFRPVR